MRLLRVCMFLVEQIDHEQADDSRHIFDRESQDVRRTTVSTLKRETNQ